MNMTKAVLLVCLLFVFIAPVLADVSYTHTIDPESPHVGDVVTDYVESSWADETHKGSMVFDWSQSSGNDKHILFTQTVDSINDENYDYFTYHVVDNHGSWKIYFEEFDGSGDTVGGGRPSDFESFRVLKAPAFSSYTMLILSFVGIYFVLRKKIM
jgi:hypothetical protein